MCNQLCQSTIVSFGFGSYAHLVERVHVYKLRVLVEDVLVHKVWRLEEFRARDASKLACLLDFDVSCTKPAQLTETRCWVSAGAQRKRKKITNIS